MTQLIAKRDYTLNLQYEFTQEIKEFLNAIVWGSEGTVYEHPITDEYIAHFVNPHLIILRKEQAIFATVLLLNYQVGVGEKEVFNSYHIRYFASSPDFRGHLQIARFARDFMNLMREQATEPTIFNAYVERKNPKSMKLVESVGFEPISKINTLGFSRFFPKYNKYVFRVESESEKEVINASLSVFYRDFSCVHFHHIHHQNNYFVFKQNDEVLAGIQVFEVAWKMKKMDGFLGKIVMNIVPHIPILNRLFNPKNFRFLAFEGIYFKAGQQDKLIVLMEGVLAEFGYNSTMFWLDERQTFELKKQSLGLLNAFAKGTGTVLMMNFEKMNPVQIRQARELPAYISCFDFL